MSPRCETAVSSRCDAGISLAARSSSSSRSIRPSISAVSNPVSTRSTPSTISSSNSSRSASGSQAPVSPSRFNAMLSERSSVLSRWSMTMEGTSETPCALATSHRPWPSTMVPSASIRIGRHRPNLWTLASSFALCFASRRRTLRDAGRRLSRARVSKRSLGARSLRLGRGACVSISLSAR